MKKALITGITGQDGSYLAELLLDKGYSVHGVIRRSSSPNPWRIQHIQNKLILHNGDITDKSFICGLIAKKSYDEVYNLAAQSFVKYSFNNPEDALRTNALAPITMMESIRRYSSNTKFYQASTSEMYGGFPETRPQDETTEFKPQSPYGYAKEAAHHHVRLMRNQGVFACAGILFNHESARRGMEFVTRKIIRHVAEISLGERSEIVLGDIDTSRDWGYAPDYVRGMWLMMQRDNPDDYILAQGHTTTVREFLIMALLEAKLIDSTDATVVKSAFEKYVRQDRKFMRPNEVRLLHGNPEKAQKQLKWVPYVGLNQMIKIMMEIELQRITTGKDIIDNPVFY